MRRIDTLRTLSAAALMLPALPARAQTPTKISVGVNASSDISPLLWAKTSGMFEKAGLDVDIQKMTSGSAAISAVIGGSLDMARASLLPLLNARAHNVPVELVAAGDLAVAGDPTEAIVVAANSPITSGKQLNGATLPTPSLHDFNEIATRAWIDKTGGDSSTVKFIEMPISAIVPAILEARLPAGMVTDPSLKSALTAGGVKIIGRANTAIAGRYLITSYVSTTSWVDAHRAAAAAFARTLYASARYTADHHADVVNAVAPFWGLPPSVLANMPAQPEAYSLNPKELQPLIDAAARYGVIPKAFPAESMMLSGR